MMFTDSIWHHYLQRPYKLHYVDHGGSGPVVILLHGIAASSQKWSNLIPLISGRYHCITIDLIGFGESPKPQWYDYTMEDHLRSIRRTIKSLRIKEPYTLIGHSLGSLLATRYASTWSQQIEHLILLSPPVYAPFGTTFASKAAEKRNEWLLKIYAFMRTNPRMTPENFKLLSYVLPLPKSIVRDPQTWLPFMRSLEHCVEQQTIIEDIIYIPVPIDIFYGSLDQVVVPYNVRELQSLTDVDIHPVAGVNHDVSKRYAKIVAAFLNS